MIETKKTIEQVLEDFIYTWEYFDWTKEANALVATELIEPIVNFKF